MKLITKLTSIFLCLVLVFTLASCAVKPQTDPDPDTKVETEKEEKQEQETPVDPNAVEIPPLSKETIEEFAKENGAEDVTVKKDGSVKVEMTDEEYNAMMENLKQTILAKLEEIRQSDDMIESVQTGLDFDKYYIFVDKAKYEANPSAIDISSCLESAEMYQALDGKKTKDIRITLYICDKENDLEIAKIPYVIK